MCFLHKPRLPCRVLEAQVPGSPSTRKCTFCTFLLPLTLTASYFAEPSLCRKKPNHFTFHSAARDNHILLTHALPWRAQVSMVGERGLVRLVHHGKDPLAGEVALGWQDLPPAGCESQPSRPNVRTSTSDIHTLLLSSTVYKSLSWTVIGKRDLLPKPCIY